MKYRRFKFFWVRTLKLINSRVFAIEFLLNFYIPSLVTQAHLDEFHRCRVQSYQFFVCPFHFLWWVGLGGPIVLLLMKMIMREGRRSVWLKCVCVTQLLLSGSVALSVSLTTAAATRGVVVVDDVAVHPGAAVAPGVVSASATAATTATEGETSVSETIHKFQFPTWVLVLKFEPKLLSTTIVSHQWSMYHNIGVLPLLTLNWEMHILLKCTGEHRPKANPSDKEFHCFVFCSHKWTTHSSLKVWWLVMVDCDHKYCACVFLPAVGQSRCGPVVMAPVFGGGRGTHPRRHGAGPAATALVVPGAVSTPTAPVPSCEQKMPSKITCAPIYSLVLQYTRTWVSTGSATSSALASGDGSAEQGRRGWTSHRARKRPSEGKWWQG